MKLAVVSSGDPLSPSVWSGTPYYMTRALRSAFPDVFIVRAPRPRLWRQIRRGLTKFTMGAIDIEWLVTTARSHADAIVKSLERERVEAAICIGASPLSAFVAQRLPVAHVSDATVPLMESYYKEFSNLLRPLMRNAALFDAVSVRNSKAALFPTEWAAQSARKTYETAQVHVIPWGCNLDPPPERIDYEEQSECRLVFVGVDWKRKGGEIFLDAFEQLLEFGCPCSVDLIGSHPNLTKRLAGIRAAGFQVREHGFITKSTEQGRTLFDSIMRQASFLFVPTRQDCYGLVFAEASAYGVPSVATHTGGVPGVIEDGVNGYLLNEFAGSTQYAEVIRNIWSDKDRYLSLRHSARQRFEEQLNWPAWAQKAVPIIRHMS